MEVVVLNVLAEVKSVSWCRRLEIDCVTFSRANRSKNRIQDGKNNWGLGNPLTPAHLSQYVELTMVAQRAVSNNASNPKEALRSTPH